MNGEERGLASTDRSTGGLWPYVWLYGMFFSAWGILLPYLYRFLVAEGHSKRFVMWIAAIYSLVSIFAPPIWGYCVDRFLNRKATMIFMLATSGAVFLLFLSDRLSVPPIWVMVLFAVFATPIIPTMDALTLRNVSSQFASVRSAGTLTFLLTSLCGGIALKWIGQRELLALTSIGLWLTIFSVWFVRDRGAREDRRRDNAGITLREVLGSVRRKGLIPFFLFGFLNWMALMPYLTMFSIYLDEMLEAQGIGNPGLWIGVAWSVSTLMEFIFFLVSNRLLRRFDARALFAAILVASLVRYTVFAVAAPLWAILLVQTTHCLGFALFYILGTRLVASEAPPEMRNSYQALWASLVVGLGGFLGGLLNGWAIGRFAIEHVFWFSNALILLSAIPLVLFLRRHPIDRERLITGHPRLKKA